MQFIGRNKDTIILLSSIKELTPGLRKSKPGWSD